MRDLVHNLFGVPFVSGTIIDRRDYNSLALFMVQAAAAAMTVTVEHGNSPDGSDMAPVPADELNGTPAGASQGATGGLAISKVGYRGTRRYVRVTAATGGFDAGVAIMTGGLRRPYNQ